MTFYGPGDRILDLVPRARVVDLRELGLNERQIEAVLCIGEHGRITTGEYRNLVNVSDATAYRDLKELCERGLIQQRGRGRSTHYVLAG